MFSGSHLFEALSDVWNGFHAHGAYYFTVFYGSLVAEKRKSCRLCTNGHGLSKAHVDIYSFLGRLCVLLRCRIYVTSLWRSDLNEVAVRDGD